jgi:thiol-disulfide isomerase/thioredoxin
MKKRFLFLLLMAGFFSVQSQTDRHDFTLSLEVKDCPDTLLFWAHLYGDEVNVIDTLENISRNTFSYDIPFGTLPGVYRILFSSRKKYLDVVFDNENIILSSVYSGLLNHLVIHESEATRKYHSFMKHDSYIDYRMELVNYMLERYPEADSFYQALQLKYQSLLQEKNQLRNKMIAETSPGFLSDLIGYMTVFYPDSLKNQQEMVDFQKHHFFDARFQKSLVLHSPAVPQKLLAYLALFRNAEYDKITQETAFEPAVDTVLAYAAKDAELFDFTVNFLIDGFKRFGFNQLVSYIAQQAETSLNCVNESQRQVFQDKLMRIRAVSPGAPASPIVLPGLSGDTLSLYDVKKNYTVLVFWAAWCPHCRKLLPDLQKFYEKYGEIAEIFAVSLDTGKQEWSTLAQPYPWYHVSELKGWESQVATDYMVFATPTLFLLDENKNILMEADLPDIRRYIRQHP